MEEDNHNLADEEGQKEDYNKERKTCDDCVTNHGIVVDGMGVLMSHAKKQTEIMQKIKDLLYFLEKRQQEWFELEHPDHKKEFSR